MSLEVTSRNDVMFTRYNQQTTYNDTREACRDADRACHITSNSKGYTTHCNKCSVATRTSARTSVQVPWIQCPAPNAIVAVVQHHELYCIPRHERYGSGLSQEFDDETILFHSFIQSACQATCGVTPSDWDLRSMAGASG